MKRLILLFTFAAIVFTLNHEESSSSDDFAARKEEELFTGETMDISDLNWIRAAPEFAKLKGIRIPAGPAGYLKSFKVIEKTLLIQDTIKGIKIPSLFKELRKFYYMDPEGFKTFITYAEHNTKFSALGNFSTFLIKFGEFELAKLVKKYARFGDNVNSKDSEISEIFATHIRAHPNDFFDFYGCNFHYAIPESLKFLFNLDLSQDQMKKVFEGRQKCAIKVLEAACTMVHSSYLLQPEVKKQLLKIYHTLDEKSKTKMQPFLYYRDIFSANEVNLKPIANPEPLFPAMLLGPHKDAIFGYESGSNLQRDIISALEKDPSILDWVITRIDRSLILQPPYLASEKEPAAKDDQTLDFMDLESARELNDDYRVNSLLYRKNIVAYVLSGQTDFLRFLKEAPVELLELLKPYINYQFSIEEYTVYLSRISDKRVSDLFSHFWDYNRWENNFAAFAHLLIDRASRIPGLLIKGVLREDRYGDKILENLELLERLKKMGIKVYLEYKYIRYAILNETLFENMMQNQQVFIDSLINVHHDNLTEIIEGESSKHVIRHQRELRSIDFTLSTVQIDRLLKLLNLSLHELLELYWSTHRISKLKLNVDYFYRAFSILKRWKQEHPNEVTNILASSSRSLRDFVNDERVFHVFDAESQELLRAHLLMSQKD